MLVCARCNKDLSQAAELFGEADVKAFHDRIHVQDVIEAMADLADVAVAMAASGEHGKSCSYPSGDCGCGYLDLLNFAAAYKQAKRRAVPEYRSE